MENYSKKLHNLIPGGAHTYSRGDDQFPNNAPQILSKAKGVYVWAPNGKKYLDYGMGLRSVNIGYGNKEIADAAYSEIIKGNNLTRPSTTELEAAELITDLIPSAEMVKFAKHGSTVTTAAIKLARAFTDRKYIAVPSEHPFFSFDDWFIGSTNIKKGTLNETSDFTLKFNYNNSNSLSLLFQKYPNQIAAVIMEPATSVGPCPTSCNFKNNCMNCSNHNNNFLKKVQSICKENGTLFILDEMITGFRWDINGAQNFYGIEPDLSTFGKAMANGFSLAALTGKREVMSMGNILNKGQERVFLTSTTHGAEMNSLGAFIKTVEILEREDGIKKCWEYGLHLKNEINEISKNLGILDFFYVEGYPCSPNYVTLDNTKNNSLEFRTLFQEVMIQNKILIPYISISLSHSFKELDLTLKAVNKALKIYRDALEKGVFNFLKSSPIKPVFRKFN